MWGLKMKRVRMVVFDWAGTTVDYGCFAPVSAFAEAFAAAGVEVSSDEIRSFMGMKKRDHLRAMLKTDEIAFRWTGIHGSAPDDSVVDDLYRAFEDRILPSLADYSSPIPGVSVMVEHLRESGLRIGSTTGYTRNMMDIVAPGAAAEGYAPDCIVCSDEVPAGRPEPYMIWKNAVELAVPRLDAVVKVGDTVADIREGRNAGTWSVGVIEGGSAWGLSAEDTRALSEEKRRGRAADIRHSFLSAGAHHVIDRIDELPALLRIIEGLLGAGRSPG